MLAGRARVESTAFPWGGPDAHPGGAAHPSWNCWAHDDRTVELYRQRCAGTAPEMTCAAQAATLLGQLAEPGETLLDAGCGAGHYYRSLLTRNIDLEYYGLDYTPVMIETARLEVGEKLGIGQDRFRLDAIENLAQLFDNVLCFNVLTNSPHYAQPLRQLLTCTRKRLLLRENLGAELTVRFSPDPYLNADATHLRVYHNTYPLTEVMAFIEEHGFQVRLERDWRTNDGVELVVDVPHTWRILVAERR